MKIVLLHWVGRYWWSAIFTPGRGYYPLHYFGEGSFTKPPHEQVDNLAGIEMPVIRA